MPNTPMPDPDAFFTEVFDNYRNHVGGDQAGPLCVSGPNVAALEDEQYTIGRGPCRDAFRTGLAVHARNMARSTWTKRSTA